MVKGLERYWWSRFITYTRVMCMVFSTCGPMTVVFCIITIAILIITSCRVNYKWVSFSFSVGNWIWQWIPRQGGFAVHNSSVWNPVIFYLVRPVFFVEIFQESIEFRDSLLYIVCVVDYHTAQVIWNKLYTVYL